MGTFEISQDSIQRALRHVRRVEEAPAVAFRSMSHQLDKANGEKGTRAIRVIRVACPSWREFYHNLLEVGAKQLGTDLPPFSWVFAASPQRGSDVDSANCGGET